MISYDKTLVEALDKVLPTHYEYFIKPSTKTPCITYRQYDDYDTLTGDTIEYTQLTYLIKIWSPKKKELEDNAIILHRVMQELGFRRVSTNELFTDNMGQKIMLYEGTTYNLRKAEEGEE